MSSQQPAHVRRYRTYRTLAIIFIALGVILTLALIVTPVWILGVIMALAGLALLASARGQLKRATTFDPTNFEPLAYDGDLDVVGEAAYAEPIRLVYTATGASPTHVHDAVLVHERTNKQDPNAIGVVIPHDGKQYPVGYLPRATAAAVLPIVTSYTQRGKSPTVAAMIGEPFEGERGDTIQQVKIRTR